MAASESPDMAAENAQYFKSMHTALVLPTATDDQILEGSIIILEAKGDEHVEKMCGTNVVKAAIANVKNETRQRVLNAALESEAVSLQVETTRLLDAQPVPHESNAALMSVIAFQAKASRKFTRGSRSWRISFAASALPRTIPSVARSWNRSRGDAKLS